MLYRGIRVTFSINRDKTRLAWQAIVDGEQEYGITKLKHDEDIPMMKEALFLSAQERIDDILDGCFEELDEDMAEFRALEEVEDE